LRALVRMRTSGWHPSCATSRLARKHLNSHLAMLRFHVRNRNVVSLNSGAVVLVVARSTDLDKDCGEYQLTAGQGSNALASALESAMPSDRVTLLGKADKSSHGELRCYSQNGSREREQELHLVHDAMVSMDASQSLQSELQASDIQRLYADASARRGDKVCWLRCLAEQEIEFGPTS
jgi:hypothetical protein